MSATAIARSTDPQTSHDAAGTVGHISETQAAIMVLLRETPMCDERLIAEYRVWEKLERFPRASDQSIRSRRAELVRYGLVAYAGFDERMTTGRFGRVWKVVR